MKNIKRIVGLAFCAIAVHGQDPIPSQENSVDKKYQETVLNAKWLIEDFYRVNDCGRSFGSVDRLHRFNTQDRLFEEIEKASRSDFKNVIADWSGGHQEAPLSCVAQGRLRAALLSFGKSEEEKAAITKQYKAEANACLERFDDFRKSYMAWNYGGTEFGAQLLDKRANKDFKP